MSENLPCNVHAEQIKTLFKRVDELSDLQDIIHSLDKNLAIQTEMLKNIVKHNEKQDKRMDEQQEVIIKINANLTELNEGQKALNKRVGKLEDKVNENEQKKQIDIIDLLKNFVLKYAIPFGVGWGIIKLIQNL